MIRLVIASLALTLLLVIDPGATPADAPPTEAKPLRILTPRGGQTRQRVVTVKGTTPGTSNEQLTLVLNGVPLPLPASGGAFQTQQVLAPGWNSIRIERGKGAQREVDEVAVFARVPRKDLRIAMTWDTPGTDIDLWVTGPDGEKVFYSHKQGAAGGALDVDVTTGYGPETYTQARIQRGRYRVQAHYYGSGPPTRVTVTVIQHEGTSEERREVFRGILVRRNEILEVANFAAE